MNAQENGYMMLVIVDDHEEDINQLNLISKNQSTAPSLLIGIEVDIPAIMISKVDGESLIQNITKARTELNKVLKAVIRFPEITRTERVKYEYWFSPMD